MPNDTAGAAAKLSVAPMMDWVMISICTLQNKGLILCGGRCCK